MAALPPMSDEQLEQLAAAAAALDFESWPAGTWVPRLVDEVQRLRAGLRRLAEATPKIAADVGDILSGYDHRPDQPEWPPAPR